MEKQAESQGSKVVSLFATKPAVETKTNDVVVKPSDDEESFSDAVKKNMANQERLRKERLKANQSVLKSYRIKN